MTSNLTTKTECDNLEKRMSPLARWILTNSPARRVATEGSQTQTPRPQISSVKLTPEEEDIYKNLPHYLVKNELKSKN